MALDYIKLVRACAALSRDSSSVVIGNRGAEG
jgi:hypothetical protein